MENNEKISIILPVYNGEKTLNRCIQSVIKQTYTNFELIVIDDCSIDKTKCIVEEYSKKDTRINVIENKHNLGVSRSRNLGIKKAMGKYITFIDADDIFECNALQTMYDIITKKNIDAVRYSYKICNKESISEKKYSDKYNDKIYTNENINVFVEDLLKNNEQAYVWLLIIKADIAKKVAFREELGMMEDTVWYIEILYKIDTLYFCNNVLYNYMINNDSASNSLYNAKRNIENMLKIKEIYDKLFYKKNKYLEYNEIYSTGLLKVILENIFKVAINKEKNTNKISFLNQLLYNNIYQNIKNNSNINEIRIDRKILLKFLDKKMFYILIYYCNVKNIIKKIGRM